MSDRPCRSSSCGPSGGERARSRTWAADWSVATKALYHEGLWVAVRSGRQPRVIGEFVDTRA